MAATASADEAHVDVHAVDEADGAAAVAPASRQDTATRFMPSSSQKKKQKNKDANKSAIPLGRLTPGCGGAL
jgi:hypothetical protein